MRSNKKIYTLDTLPTRHFRTERVVFVTGVFDLLHPGHVVFLRKARQCGDILVVGVESDKKAAESKGTGRPLVRQRQRVLLVSALEAVDIVVPLPYVKDPWGYAAICKQVGSRCLAVTAGDPYLAQKREIMHSLGGNVRIVTRRILPYSSSSMIEESAARSAIRGKTST